MVSVAGSKSSRLQGVRPFTWPMPSNSASVARTKRYTNELEAFGGAFDAPHDILVRRLRSQCGWRMILARVKVQNRYRILFPGMHSISDMNYVLIGLQRKRETT